MFKWLINKWQEKQILKSSKKDGPCRNGKDYLFNIKDKMGWNIYDPGKEYGQHFKKFQFVHYVLKYKFLVPIINFASKFFDKYIEKEVPKYHYNTNMTIFDEAYEATIITYVKKYITKEREQSGEPITKKTLDAALNGSSIKLLRTLKNTVLTIALNDTAYREFLNILIFEITKKTQEEYKGCDKVKHLFYTSQDTIDPSYYGITKMFYDEKTKNKEIVVEEMLSEEERDAKLKAEKDKCSTKTRGSKGSNKKGKSNKDKPRRNTKTKTTTKCRTSSKNK